MAVVAAVSLSPVVATADVKRPYMMVQAPTWALLRFNRGSDLLQPAAHANPWQPPDEGWVVLVPCDPDEHGPYGGLLMTVAPARE